LGYSEEQLDEVPDGANLGLGCGNPTALAALQTGEVVVDLGSGGGLDAFISAQRVGPSGRVIGVDMTPDMLARARRNAVEMGVEGYVEFREGLIEQMPIAADTADVIISNCVINLSPDKPAVFREAFRVLKSGGRLAVSDIVLSEALPLPIQQLASAYSACVAGAATEAEYIGAIEAAGFVDVRFTRTPAATLFDIDGADPVVKAAIDALGPEQIESISNRVWSYKVEARKP